MSFLKRGMLISLSTAMVAVLLLLLRASPAAAAGTCAQDVFQQTNSTTKGLGCTANDVNIASASNPRDLSGNPQPTCFPGTKLDFLVDFNVVTTSTSARSNVGLYLGKVPVGQPGSSALTGSCSDNIISPRHLPGASTTCDPTVTPNCLGDTTYHELDGSPTTDNCGDTTASSTDIVTVELSGVTCPALGATAIVLPDCTTWQVPGKTIACFSDPGSGYPFSPNAIPGTTSKCSCGQVSIPIIPISPHISATKTPNPTSKVEPGGTFGYTVVVTDDSPAGDPGVTINQICDDKYGNIATATTNPAQNPCAPGALCPAGSPAGSTCATSISCSPSIPASLARNTSVTCTFNGSVTGFEPLSSKDTITANGIGSGQVLQATANATVTIGEAAAAASVSKTLDGAQECAIARYKVEVDNLSPGSTDETETLTSLLDSSFGDITVLGSASANPTVVGTTCGVANGLGTLAGTANGAGMLPATIAVGVGGVPGKYTCEFDGKFCAALGNVVGVCTTALENKDTVTANLTLDRDGVCSGGTNAGNLCNVNADCPGTGATCILTLSPTASLTVDSCFSHTP
jgi:hypothetical protein